MIVLASTSTTRQAMLKAAGLEFRAISPGVDERQLASQHPEWSPDATAMGLASAKARDVSRRHPGALAIGADQVLALEDRMFSKPSDIEACRSQLKALRGKTHRLISAVACSKDGEVVWTHSDQARLTMREFSDIFLEDYLQRNGSDVCTSVGGYKVEGSGIQLFSIIDGDHFTILGLPLVPLLGFLRTVGELPA